MSKGPNLLRMYALLQCELKSLQGRVQKAESSASLKIQNNLMVTRCLESRLERIRTRTEAVRETCKLMPSCRALPTLDGTVQVQCADLQHLIELVQELWEEVNE